MVNDDCLSAAGASLPTVAGRGIFLMDDLFGRRMMSRKGLSPNVFAWRAPSFNEYCGKNWRYR